MGPRDLQERPLGPDELATVAAAQQRARDQAATTRRGWSETPCSCIPPGGLGRSELAPNCSVSVVPELPSRLHSPQLGNLNKLLALCNP
jgi:hypothetical protein